MKKMRYRRNADESLRQAEREYTQSQTAENLLAYNRARRRAGLLPIEPSTSTMRQLLSRELAPYYWVSSVTGMQFMALEARFDIAQNKMHAPRNKDEYLEVHDLMMSKIPLVVDMGCVALVHQQGVVSLDVYRDRDYDQYVVRWREDGKLIEKRHYYTDSKEDAKNTMSHMLLNSHPRQYPSLYVVPASILRPTGRITAPVGGTLLADNWRKDSDPRTLTQPEFRRGGYPTEVILVRVGPEEENGKNYFTSLWRVPYDQPGVEGNRDHGNYQLTRELARADYVHRLLRLPDEGSYRLYDS